MSYEDLEIYEINEIGKAILAAVKDTGVSTEVPPPFSDRQRDLVRRFMKELDHYDLRILRKHKINYIPS
jgi:hypothetical protein